MSEKGSVKYAAIIAIISSVTFMWLGELLPVVHVATLTAMIIAYRRVKTSGKKLSAKLVGKTSFFTLGFAMAIGILMGPVASRQAITLPYLVWLTSIQLVPAIATIFGLLLGSYTAFWQKKGAKLKVERAKRKFSESALA